MTTHAQTTARRRGEKNLAKDAARHRRPDGHKLFQATCHAAIGGEDGVGRGLAVLTRGKWRQSGRTVYRSR